MDTKIQIEIHGDIEDNFLNNVRIWLNEVLRISEKISSPPYLSVSIWKTMEQYYDFYQREKEGLGIVTGQEKDFLATHDAWRGYPRIHICQERLIGIDETVIQGVIHHETAHALFHGSSEFYTFHFSKRLQEAGLLSNMDFYLLQQCVYLLSIAIKDQDITIWLARNGLGFSQVKLLYYLLSDTEEEHKVWQEIRESHALRKIAFSAFLKTLLPIEAMISAGIREAQALKDRWNKVYWWLSVEERNRLSLLARTFMVMDARNFQERLEQAAFHLITKPSL